MGNWILRWNFNKTTYTPGENAFVYFWLENTGNTELYLGDIQLEFDFGTYGIVAIDGEVPLNYNRYLGFGSLLLSKQAVGKKIFTIRYHMYERVGNIWNDLGLYTSDLQYFINIYPYPLYRIFVSRGLSIEDRAIGDPIAELIREWGFTTATIGIEVQVPDELVPGKVKEEISIADATIAIATPRFRDAITGLWRTLEWHHGEVGIAFGIDKPLLILKDKRVSLGGLPSYLAELKKAPIIEFDPYNIDELKMGLSTVMPGLRGWIETKRRQEFFNGLGKIVVGGLAIAGGIAIVSGIIGALTAASKK